jgi:integrase
MPRQYEMTWLPKRLAWRKMFRGQTYQISTRQLEEQGHEVLSHTKDGSRIAANGWWRQKEIEVEAASRPARRTPLPLEDVVSAWVGHPIYDITGDVLEGGPDPSLPEEERARANLQRWLAEMLTELAAGGAMPHWAKYFLPPTRLQQIEAGVKGLRGEPSAAPDKRLGAHAETWLAEQKLRAEAGDISPGGYDNKRRWVGPFLDFVGRDSAAEAVTDPLLDAWDNHCLGKRAEGAWKDYWARDVRVAVKEFVRWLADRGLIPRPAYLGRKSRRFRLEAREVKPWSVEEYRAALAATTPRTEWAKLVLLLAANCGFYGKDAADLKDSEVDWDRGYVERKRSKAKNVQSAPVVRYKLWPTTLALLKKYRSGGGRVLVTNRGTAFVRDEMKGGKVRRANAFRNAMDRIRDRVRQTTPGFDGSSKGVRKMAATLLEEHPAHGRYAQHFLGHAPSTTAGRHYVRPSQEQFDEAVTWLGKQLGQVEGGA